jgi:hypothetical protein
MGVVPVGSHPFRPFIVQSEDKVTLDDDRTEVHAAQQDLIGGIIVPEDDQALFLTMQVDGAPAVDVFVVGKEDGDRIVDRIVHTPGPTTLGAPPLLADTVTAGTTWKRVVPVPKGAYYLMVDNSSVVGQASPPAIQGDDRAARVDYVVELGDR